MGYLNSARKIELGVYVQRKCKSSEKPCQKGGMCSTPDNVQRGYHNQKLHAKNSCQMIHSTNTSADQHWALLLKALLSLKLL